MNRMFQEAKAFNGDISTWDTKNVGYGYMFSGATTFNKDISGWNVDNVSTMEKCLKCQNLTVQYLSWLTQKFKICNICLQRKRI